MKATCERLWEVDAFREGRLVGADAASSERHRVLCATCRDRFEADERLREVALAVRYPTMDALRARRLRARILRGVGQRAPSPPRLPFVLAFAALTIAIVLLAGWSRMTSKAAPVAAAPRAAPAPLAGSVVALHDSVWSQSREANTERVRLERGELRVRVRKQTSNERFFVELPDGNIEVRGTQFDVRVEGPKTVSIVVSEGVVAFHPRGEPERVLVAGQSWPPPTAPAPAPTPSMTPAPAAKPAPVDTTADEYDAAVRAYLQHDYEGAAKGFERFEVEHPRARQLEDATFLHASALAYAGHDDAAAKLSERFLKQYPTSIHARDAAELVARAARKTDAGE